MSELSAHSYTYTILLRAKLKILLESCKHFLSFFC